MKGKKMGGVVKMGDELKDLKVFYIREEKRSREK